MPANEVNTVIDSEAPELTRRLMGASGRPDSAAAATLLAGRLELCGHTWEMPLRPHWSEDPFESPQWRREYQTLSWLGPLRRRATAGDLEARQGWWWLAAAWLNSLERLRPGEGTPWRQDVAALRTCELVAGLNVVGKQPWLLAAITTHLIWLETTADQFMAPEARPLSLAARYLCHRAAGDTERAEEYVAELANWRSEHFSPAGAPYPDSAAVTGAAAQVLEIVEAYLTSVSAPWPWTGHDHRLAESLNTLASQVENTDTRIQIGSDQGFRLFVLNTDRAAYASALAMPTGGGFVGFEDSDGGSAVDVSFAQGGRVWLRGAVPIESTMREFPRSYSVKPTSNAFEINLDLAIQPNRSSQHRIIHSLSSGVSIWEGDTDEPFDLPAWFGTVKTASDQTITVSPGSIRLTSGDRAFFLVRLPVHDIPDKLTPTNVRDPSFRLYVGPWHARLVDVLHQSGPVTAQLTKEHLSRLAGPSEPDNDLVEVYAGAGWNIAANRMVLRAEQSRVQGAGHLVLTSPDGNYLVTGRGSRAKRGYLNIGAVPNGQYEILWAPINRPPRRGPRLMLTDDAAAPAL